MQLLLLSDLCKSESLPVSDVREDLSRRRSCEGSATLFTTATVPRRVIAEAS